MTAIELLERALDDDLSADDLDRIQSALDASTPHRSSVPTPRRLLEMIRLAGISAEEARLLVTSPRHAKMLWLFALTEDRLMTD